MLFCLYAFSGDLGVDWEGGVPTIRLWAPTAQAVTLHVFDDAGPKAIEALSRKAEIEVTGATAVAYLFALACLLAGIVLTISQTGSTAFEHMTLGGTASWLMFIGIAVNAAIPPLHPWLSDAYPEATVTGAVFLSAFTTKSAVYVMARNAVTKKLVAVARLSAPDRFPQQQAHLRPGHQFGRRQRDRRRHND